MKIFLNNHYPIDVEKEAKELAREKGVKIKDISYVRIVPYNDNGACLQVYTKDHSLITNEAC